MRAGSYLGLALAESVITSRNYDYLLAGKDNFVADRTARKQ